MRQLHAYAIELALLGSTAFAAAQTTPAHPSGGQQGQLNLNQSQDRAAVMNGLRGEQTQPAPSGPQAQVGSKVPDSVTPQAMPSGVTAQVPETKDYLFVKLPDRVPIIDPNSKMVAEIILTADTTGTAHDGSASPTQGGQR
jgi:hypothetical protein